MTDRATVRPADLYRRVRGGDPLTVVDVRDRDEFAAWHVEGPAVDARQVPHVKFLQAKVQDRVGTFAADLDFDPDDPLVVVCARGEASAAVADLLREAGFDAANLADGMNGWARVYVDRDLPADATAPGVAVCQYDRPSSGCLSYLVASGGEAAVLDPLRAFADRYVADARARGADLAYAVDTHVHADHVSGVRAVADATGARAVLPEGASDRGLALDATLLADGDVLDVGDASLEAVHAPGHTPELTAFALGDVLFTADALFLDSVGRPDLLGDGRERERATTLYETLHDRILGYPDETLIAPGHYDPGNVTPADREQTGEKDRVERPAVASLGDVCASTALLGVDREAFVDRVAGEASPQPANHEQIIAVNLGREDVPDETAFELELGPNNCAV